MAESVDVVIEVPRGSRNKYEYDEQQGVVRLDRRLAGPVVFPADYGFVPGTVGEDGEPLDALVLLEEPAYPGVWVSVIPIGVFWIRTDGGREAKLVCVPQGDPAFSGIDDLGRLPEHQRAQIANFFDVYKMLEPGSSVCSDGYDGAEAARAVLAEARRRHAAEG